MLNSTVAAPPYAKELDADPGTWQPGNPPIGLLYGALLNYLAADNLREHGLLSVQEMSRRCEVIHMGSRIFTEWVRPLSLSTQMGTNRCSDLRMHPEIPLLRNDLLHLD
jgi:hypothetical protein